MALTKAFCGSSSQKPLHPFRECIRERGLSEDIQGNVILVQRIYHKAEGKYGHKIQIFQLQLFNNIAGVCKSSVANFHIDLEHDLSLIDSIPGIEEVPKDEWSMGSSFLAPRRNMSK